MSDQYAGRIGARLSRPGLELAETSYSGGQTVDRHVHERPLVVLVVSGRMEERLGSGAVDCPVGTALFHPPGEAHGHRFGDRGSRCLVLQFGPTWRERLEVEPSLVPDRPVRVLDETATSVGRLLHRELRLGERAQEAAVDGLALTLLASIARPEAPRRERRPAFLDRVLERLHDDPAADAQLSHLAELAGVSPEHLARTFRSEKGLTVGEYVRRLRVRRARRALGEDDIALSRLALDLGFYDQAHFTRTFKAHVGCPPGEYRRRVRAAGSDPPGEAGKDRRSTEAS